MRAETAILDVEIAKRTSPANLEQYAVKGQMQVPNTKKRVFVQPEGSVAMTLEHR